MPDMERRALGRTGLQVSALGFGAGHVGSAEMGEDDAGTLLNRALDRGVDLVDTARGYGLSEERIGRHLAWRRDDFHLVTKVGYLVEGAEDWTAAAIERGLEQALRRLRTDRVEVVLLHSCPREVLERDDVLRALESLRSRGLARFVGYSGENADLDRALELDAFSVVETSVNLVDQGIYDRLARIEARGVGVIAKRPLANAFWRFAERPRGEYAEAYWARWRELGLGLGEAGMPLEELALRFALSVPFVSSAIVGTARIANLERNLGLAALGPLSPAVVARLRAAWAPFRGRWPGEV
jgi:aryl-alcohol dehydrogenase-like predicted oxidoreductase